MTIAEQRAFIDTLIKRIHGEILFKLGDMPSAWDGVELRQYIADCFDAEAPKPPMQGARSRNYRNEIAISAHL